VTGRSDASACASLAGVSTGNVAHPVTARSTGRAHLLWLRYPRRTDLVFRVPEAACEERAAAVPASNAPWRVRCGFVPNPRNPIRRTDHFFLDGRLIAGAGDLTSSGMFCRQRVRHGFEGGG